MDPVAKRFLILCDPRLARPYALQFGEISEDYSFEFHCLDDPDLFILECLRTSPAAGLIDLASLIRGKTEKMNRLFSFRTTWPVLRTRVDSRGAAEIMRMTPSRKAPFDQAVIEIANGGSDWENLDETRSHLRSVVRCRARLRNVEDNANWNCVNIETLSRGGCLVVASTVPAPKTQVEIEILDLPRGTAQLRAEVTWSQSWNDSNEIPRCGLQFCAEELPENIAEALGDPSFYRVLC